MRTRPPLLRSLVDVVVLVLMICAAALSFAASYGGSAWLTVAAAASAAGALGVWLLARFGLSGWWAVPLTLVLYFLLGPVLVLPDLAVAGVLPGPETTRVLATGVITSWQQQLTVAVPTGYQGVLDLPILLICLVAGAVAAAVVTFTSRTAPALVAPAAVLVVGALLGTRGDTPPVWLGLGLLALALLWLSWRRRFAVGPDGGGLQLRRPVSAVVVLGAIVAAGLWLAPSTPDQRTALREFVEPPFDPREHPSPLAGFRNFVRDEAARDTELFRVTGLPADTPLVLAVLDEFDGLEYRISPGDAQYRKVGDRIPDASTIGEIEVTVELVHYDGLWMPTIGAATGVSFTGPRASALADGFRFADGTDTAVVVGGLRAGDGYRLQTVPTVVPDEATLTTAPVGLLAQSLPTAVPEQVVEAAGEYAQGQDTPYSMVEALRGRIAERGFLSHGDTAGDQLASPSGHGAYRLARLLEDPRMVGDQEQFAPALALMVRALGLPARVVMGFRPPENYDGNGTLVVTGAETTAWVEVLFDGVGWVPFDPSPDEEEAAQTPEQASTASVRQQNLQPPPPPQALQDASATELEDPETEDKNEEDQQEDTDTGGFFGWWRWVAYPLGGAAVLLLPGLAVVLAKRRKAGRRRRADPVTGAAGAWAEYLDRAVDLGYRPEPGRTRAETAADLAERVPVAAGSVALAARVDQVVFGTSEAVPTEQIWSELPTRIDELQAGHPSWRQWRARLSPASLQRRGRTDIPALDRTLENG